MKTGTSAYSNKFKSIKKCILKVSFYVPALLIYIPAKARINSNPKNNVLERKAESYICTGKCQEARNMASCMSWLLVLDGPSKKIKMFN
jgi:hypothetical protein